jgi:hypothetical protein
MTPARLVHRAHQLLVNLVEVDPDDANRTTHAVTVQLPVGNEPTHRVVTDLQVLGRFSDGDLAPPIHHDHATGIGQLQQRLAIDADLFAAADPTRVGLFVRNECPYRMWAHPVMIGRLLDGDQAEKLRGRCFGFSS